MGANWMGRQYAGNHVDPQFLDTMGMRLVRGRNFRPGEDGVAIVNEATARVLWPDQDALGKSLPWGPARPDGDWRRAKRLDRLRGQSRTPGILPAAIAKRRAGLRPAGPCLRLAARCRPTSPGHGPRSRRAAATDGAGGHGYVRPGSGESLRRARGDRDPGYRGQPALGHRAGRPRRLHRGAAHARDRTAHRARSPPEPRRPRHSGPDEPSHRHWFRLRRSWRVGCGQQSCGAESRRCPGSMCSIRSHT